MSDNEHSGNRWENNPDENPTDEIEKAVSSTGLQPTSDRWGTAMRRPRALAGQAPGNGQVDGQRGPRGPRGSLPGDTGDDTGPGQLPPETSGTDDSESDGVGGADAGDSSAT